MPYYKGVHFEEAFHTEEDVLAHKAAQDGTAAPVDTAPAPAPAPAPSEPELAVSVRDRSTPVVEVVPAVDAEPDPFPSFVPEKEPETQPEEEKVEEKKPRGRPRKS